MQNPFGLTFRQCERTDKQFVHQLMQATIFPILEKFVEIESQMFDQDFDQNHKRFTILESEGKPVGLYSLTDQRENLYIGKIYLKPEFQGKGIGRFLMKYFESLGFTKIKLHVLENNPALEFYKSLGYQIASKEEHNYLMEKVLN